MYCIPENRDDIHRYYRHTYIKLREYGDKLFYLDEVTREYLRFHDSNNDVFDVLMSNDDPYKLEYILPHRAVFSWKGSVASLERHPARQYSRGCCETNTRLFDVFSNKALELTFASLTAFVEKGQYSSLKDAFYGEFSKKVVGVPVTNRVSFNRTDQSIWIGRRKVATFDRDAKRIVLDSVLFAPEIKALIAASNLEVGVVDANHKNV